MKDQYGDEKTPKQIAKDYVQSALWGRMQDLTSEAECDLEGATYKQIAEVKKQINKYLDRLQKTID